jgi:hypothetical protein
MLIQLFLGYRSVAFMSGCAFAWLWDRLEWKFKLRWVVAGMLAALVASAVSGDTRTRSGVERYSIRTFVDSYASLENPIVSTVSEMGNSMAAVAYTYVLVPSSRRFDNGMSYAYASLTILPNLFWAIHPAIAHGTAQDWLIWTVDARGASKQGGLGYSCIAEAYLNFGWTGVVLIMTRLGSAWASWVSGRQVDQGIWRWWPRSPHSCWVSPRRIRGAGAGVRVVLRWCRARWRCSFHEWGVEGAVGS